MRRGCKAKAYVLRFCLMPCHHTSSSRISFVLWCRIISAYPEELAVQGLYFCIFEINQKRKKYFSDSELKGVFDSHGSSLNISSSLWMSNREIIRKTL